MPARTIRLAVSGACGRMGSLIARQTDGDARFRWVAALESPHHPCIGRSCDPSGPVVTSRLTVPADVLIDFSSPAALGIRLRECVAMKAAAVVGTTGLAPRHLQLIRAAARRIPVVWTSNMSPGMNALFAWAPALVRRLGSDVDVEIVEAHHRLKKDAPSGTALTLARRLELEIPRGRRIAIHSIRAGTLPGEHRLILAGPGETIEIVHRAESREIFARGALRAALFAARAKPGLYSMIDVMEDG